MLWLRRFELLYHNSLERRMSESAGLVSVRWRALQSCWWWTWPHSPVVRQAGPGTEFRLSPTGELCRFRPSSTHKIHLCQSELRTRPCSSTKHWPSRMKSVSRKLNHWIIQVLSQFGQFWEMFCQTSEPCSRCSVICVNIFLFLNILQW